MRDLALGRIAGLRVNAAPSAVITSIAGWALLAAALVFAGYGTGRAAVLAGLAVLLHLLSELWHQLGHAWAARRIGFPMQGIRYVYLLALSAYPADEPPLSAELHIRRALGGPAASLLLALLTLPAVLLTRAGDGALFLITLFFFLDNLLFFTAGALLPIGFTDGSTILRWWPRRDRP